MALGEISSGRAALEGDPVAHGNQATLNSLRDESRRPRALREPLPDYFTNHQPALELELDRDRFLKNLRCARRGAAAGPSGMTSEHLRPILDSAKDSELLWECGQSFARGQVPAEICFRWSDSDASLRCTSHRVGSGGSWVGMCSASLVARTIAQQINPAGEQATEPFQHALTTRAGVECVAHVVQTLTDLDPQATVLSVDGVGAFDLISRAAMLEGLLGIEGGDAVLPFVFQFYSSASTYLWEDESGVSHEIIQRRGRRAR